MVRKIAFLNVKHFFSGAKWIAVLFVQFLYMQGNYAGLRRFLIDSGEMVNLVGLYAMQLCAPVPVAMAGILLTVLLSDAPFYTEAQNAVFIRCGQRTWIKGQLLYCVLVTTIYMGALLLFQGVLLAPYGYFSGDWGRVIRSIVQADAMSEYALPFAFSGGVMYQFSAGGAFGAAVVLRLIVFSTCVFLMFTINLRFRTRLGALAAMGVLLLDLLEKPYRWYVFSISSLARLSNLNFGYEEHLPEVAPALGIVLGACAGMVALALYVGRRYDVADLANRE